MSRGLLLSPFDWDRFQMLRRGGDTVGLLARGADWRDPSAAARLEALERRGVTLPALRLRYGLAADPARFAPEAAVALNALDPAEAESILVEASATAQPVDLPLPVDMLLGLFSAAWRGGVWEEGRPEPVAARPLVAALGGLHPGVRLLSPEAVRQAAGGLALLDVDGYPPAGTAPWRDGLDPEGDLDEIARAELVDIVASFARAAAEGWGVRLAA